MKQLYIGFALLFPATLMAQTAGDTLRREVTIEKDFAPIVRDASKINTLPEIEELTVTKQAIAYSDWTVPATVEPVGTWIPPVGLSTVSSEAKRGYLDVAMGNYWNVVGNVGYRILQSDRNRLNVWAQYRSTNGTVFYNQSLPDYPDKGNMRQLSDQAVIDYSHSFKRLDWDVQGGYRHDVFNYYGLKSSLLSTPLTSNQQIYRFFLKSDVISTIPNRGMDYRASLAYYRMDFLRGYEEGTPGIAENEWAADFTLTAPIDSRQAVSLDGEFTFLNYSQKGVSPFNYAMLSLSPRYNWHNDRMKLTAGVRADISFNEGTVFRFAPKVDFDWHITSGIDLYAILTGGKTLNTWRRMSGYTLYFNPSQRVPNTYTPVDFSLGVRTNLLPGFSLTLSGGYDLSYNALFALPGEENTLLTGMARIAGIDAHAIKASAKASYRYGTMVEAEAQVDYCYRIAMEQKEAISYDCPRWAGSLSATYRPLTPLAIEAGYRLAIGRDFTPVGLGKLGNMHRVHLKATYQIIPQLSLYALGDNLLNCKYDVLYGMPAQGIRFMAGIDFKF